MKLLSFLPESFTHNVSLVDEHARGALQEAIVEKWKSGDQNRYKSKVNVLLLSWKDDDLSVVTQIDLLGIIFSKCYHYSVESWEIPGEKPRENSSAV